MSEFSVQSPILIAAMDSLSAEIENNIKDEKYDDLDQLVKRSVELLEKLISLVSTDADKEKVLEYLIRTEKREQGILQIVQKEHHAIKNTLANVGSLNAYFDLSSMEHL